VLGVCVGACAVAVAAAGGPWQCVSCKVLGGCSSLITCLCVPVHQQHLGDGMQQCRTTCGSKVHSQCLLPDKLSSCLDLYGLAGWAGDGCWCILGVWLWRQHGSSEQVPVPWCEAPAAQMAQPGAARVMQENAVTASNHRCYCHHSKQPPSNSSKCTVLAWCNI